MPVAFYSGMNREIFGMYDNATKDTWRGFVWNQVADRLKRCPGAQQRVCVLAGDIAADREHATKRKLECVAVDCNLSAVKTFRKAGGVAVQDQLQNQLLALQPSAVIADLVSGLDFRVFRMFVTAQLLCDVVVFNLLRGRDKGMGEYARDIANVGLRVPEVTGRRVRWVPVGKHRGRMLFAQGMRLTAKTVMSWQGMSLEAADAYLEKFCVAMSPRFYSYQSKDSSQYFDTVVVTTQCLSKYNDSESRNLLRACAPKVSRRRAAAAKALLTMRK